MTAQLVIKDILVRNSQLIQLLHSSLSLYIQLGPFTKLSISHSSTLSQLNNQILPENMKQISNLFHIYKIQPPLPFCGIHKPAVIGILTHFSFTEKYSEEGLKNVFQKCSQNLNDSIRELNENDLQEKELRAFLINCRNDLDNKMQIFKNVNQSKDSISKALNWIL